MIDYNFKTRIIWGGGGGTYHRFVITQEKSNWIAYFTASFPRMHSHRQFYTRLMIDLLQPV